MPSQQHGQNIEANAAKTIDSSAKQAPEAKLHTETAVALSSPPGPDYKATFPTQDKTAKQTTDVVLHDSTQQNSPVKDGNLDTTKSPAALAEAGVLKDSSRKNFEPPKPDSTPESKSVPRPETAANDKVKPDEHLKSIDVHMENKDKAGAKTANFSIKLNGQVEMLRDPELDKSKKIEIEVERKAGQVNPTKEQLEAANELVRYLSARNKNETDASAPPIVLSDKDNIISRETEEKAALKAPEAENSLTPETREQVGNLNRFDGSGGADMPMEASQGMGSFDSRSVPRQVDESDKSAALKEVVAGLFSPDATDPYETIRQTPDGVTHVGRYGLSFQQINSFFDALGDPIDPAKLDELIKSGKLPKDFAEKLKDPKFLSNLKKTLKSIESGNITKADLGKALPKELQELIATDLVEKVKNRVGDQPGAVGTAVLSGKSAEQLNQSDLTTPGASETTQAGDKLYQIALEKMANKASASSDKTVGHVPEGERKELIAKALQLTGQPVTDANLAAINTIIEKESSWNPNARNDWDSNAKAGTPSQGLMQTIPGTFKENALPGYDQNICDPLSNIIAGIRYSCKTYGSLQNVPGLQAMASGGGYVGY